MWSDIAFHTVSPPVRANSGHRPTIKFRCYHTDGTSSLIPHNKLTISANGNTIKDGYTFKQAGQKKMVISYSDWKVDYLLDVVNNATLKKVDYCELLKEPTTLDYKVGEGFRASEVAIRCHYADGSTEDFDHRNIEFYASGGTVQLQNGYKFKEPGTKTVKIKFMDYEGSFKINVTT